ncbi:MAG: hypothetical protein AB7L09_19205, partial [Nitrospira sp.]
MRSLRGSFPYSAFIGIFCFLILSGCLSPITLTRAVIAYDDAITESQSKQLLVNIARAQHHQPIHFTVLPGSPWVGGRDNMVGQGGLDHARHRTLSVPARPAVAMDREP